MAIGDIGKVGVAAKFVCVDAAANPDIGGHEWLQGRTVLIWPQLRHQIATTTVLAALPRL
jgi:hypothetical protein